MTKRLALAFATTATTPLMATGLGPQDLVTLTRVVSWLDRQLKR